VNSVKPLADEAMSSQRRRNRYDLPCLQQRSGDSLALLHTAHFEVGTNQALRTQVITPSLLESQCSYI
jgi:hypothetical protein